ncbi:MAG: hypothetical protein WEE64_15720 [Dehalococcoidia bacterium]
MSRLALPMLLAALIGAALGGLLLAEQGDSPAEPTFASVQAALDADAALGRFSGRVGDFMIYRAVNGVTPPEAEIFSCPGGTPPVTDRDVLRGHELWSEALGPTGIGWSCEGELILVNNEGLEGRPGTTLLARGYISSAPVPIVRDAPADRLELIEVEGHPAILEERVEGFPYADSNVVVIERYPEGSTPGIAVFVIAAPSEEEAVRLAKELIAS